MFLSLKYTFVLLASPILGRTLNAWRQTVFGLGGSPGHGGEKAFDNDPNTYTKFIGLPGTISILLNRADAYQGLYVQSSGTYITDYYVEAYDARGGSLRIVGKVSGATSNFTVINFWNSGEQPEAWTASMWLTVTGIFDRNLGVYRNTTNSSAIINEIYPIYRGDTIEYPPGQTAQPSPTQTQPEPTPTKTTIPGYPGIEVNQWFRWLSRYPSTMGGYGSQSLVDNNPGTYAWTPLIFNGYPAQFYLMFSESLRYAGLYILSPNDVQLTDYYVTGRNQATDEDFEVCRVTGATSGLTLCRFTNEAGKPYYNTDVILIHPLNFRGGGGNAQISEVYAIYPGEEIVDPSDL